MEDQSNKDVTPIIGLTFKEARRRLQEALDTLANNCETSDHKSAVFRESVWEYFATVGIVTVLAASAVTHEQRWGSVGAAVVILLVNVMAYVLLKRARARAAIEPMERLKSISSLIQSMHDSQEDVDLQYSVLGVERGCPLTGMFPVYRDGRWARLPALLAVKGDVIALMAGDTAPVSCCSLPVTGASDEECYTLNEGDTVKIVHRPAFNRRTELDTDSVDLLRVCGDARCFELLDTVAEVYCPRVMSEMNRNQKDSMQRSIIEVRFQRLLKLASVGPFVVFFSVCMVGLVRTVITGEYDRAVHFTLAVPATAALVFCFPNYRLLYFILESISIAQILSARKQIIHQEPVTAGANLSVLRVFYDLFLIRLGLKQYEGSDLPMQNSRIAETLGASTMLCVIDDDVICENRGTVNEVFLFNGKDQKVLDLLQDENSDEFRFEDQHWHVNLPSLKPIGLACLATAQAMPNADYLHSEPLFQTEDLPRSCEGIERAEVSLLRHMAKDAPLTELHLFHLASSMGFQVDDLIQPFNERLRVEIFSPALHNERLLEATHAQSLFTVWRRGAMQAQVTASILEPKGSGPMQAMCVGNVQMVLDRCSDCWDGASISPLSASQRKSILSIHSDWDKEDFDVVALSYTPVPANSERLIGIHPSNPAILLDPSKSPKAGDKANQSQPLFSILDDQVFLGMVASSIPLRPRVQRDIQWLMDAGIRFVFFSSRNSRRSFAMAKKMGLATDWNFAISLRPLEKGEHDPFRKKTDYADYDVKARLPHGIEAIRQHLDEVDNVPLLVSLFTDSTPDTTSEMFNIFHENAENVLTIGSTARSQNLGLFANSSACIGITGLPGGQSLTSLPQYSASQLCVKDMEICDRLVGFACATTIPNNLKSEPLGLINKLLVEARRVQRNATQVFYFASFLTVFFFLLMLLSIVVPFSSIHTFSADQILWLQVVLLFGLGSSFAWSPASDSVATEMPYKENSACPLDTPDRLTTNAFSIVARTLPNAIVYTYLHVWVLSGMVNSRYGDLDDQHRCGTRYPDQWWETFSCTDLSLGSLQKEQRAAIAFTGLVLVLGLSVQSASFLHRTESVLRMSAFGNRTWCYSFIFVILVEFLHFSISLTSWDAWSSISHIPVGAWVLAFVWPWVGVFIQERVKLKDLALRNRHLTFLRLDFDTRLGMHSPR